VSPILSANDVSLPVEASPAQTSGDGFKATARHSVRSVARIVPLSLKMKADYTVEDQPHTVKG
jgi:hypothetical protein